jgi:hypothetical protein
MDEALSQYLDHLFWDGGELWMGSAAKLIVDHSTPPLRGRPPVQPIGPEHVWCVNLCPQEWEVSSKTGLPAGMHVSRTRGPGLRRRRVACVPNSGEGEPFVKESQADWNCALPAAMQDVGIPSDNVMYLSTGCGTAGRHTTRAAFAG